MDSRLLELLSQVRTELATGLPGLIALIAVCALFALAGAAVSRDRTLILMTVRGWAISAVLAIALPLLGIKSLTAILVPLAVIAAFGVFALLRRGVERYALIPSVVLGAPLVVLGCTVPSVFMDAYNHWLPNAQYLVQLNHLIEAPLPPGFYSLHPTYPPALALPVWIATQALGEFSIGTARALTTVLIVLSVPLVARLARSTIVGGGSDTEQQRPWTETLLALGAIVLLNPGAHDFAYYPAQHNVQFWSIVADPPLSILALVTLVVLAMGLANDQPGTTPSKTTPSKLDPVSLLALGALPATIKPGGEYLIAVIAIAAVLLALLARLDLRRGLVAIGWLVAGAFLAALLWKLYKLRFEPIEDLRLGAPDEWRFDLLLPFLRAIAAAAMQHILFYGLIAAGLLIGIRVVLTHRDRSSAPELLLAMSTVAFAGYVATLALAHVMSVGLGEWEVRGAYSWQRYASQGGLAPCAAALLLGLLWLRKRIGNRKTIGSAPTEPRPLKTAVVLSIVAALAYIPVVISAIGSLRYYMKERQETHQRALADLGEMPPNARFAVAGHVLPLVYVLYSAWADMDASRRPFQVASIDLENQQGIGAVVEKVHAWSEDRSIECILLIDAEELNPLLGLDPSSDHLRCNGTWRPIELSRVDFRAPISDSTDR
jgi:hypothetical protein